MNINELDGLAVQTAKANFDETNANKLDAACESAARSGNVDKADWPLFKRFCANERAKLIRSKEYQTLIQFIDRRVEAKAATAELTIAATDADRVAHC